MVFSSAVFLFIFLPVIFGLHLLPFPIRVKNGLLVAASLLFYAFGEPVYVLLMIGSAAVNYLSGRLLGIKASEKSPVLRKGILWGTVAVDIGILCLFKYSGFLVQSLNGCFGLSLPVPEIKLPIGISFFTFQALSYVIDVYRREADVQRSFWRLLLYISFFPQLVAGPIVRYSDISGQIDSRRLEAGQIACGMQRFTKGLFKKLVFANTLACLADGVFELEIGQYSLLVAWLGAVSYMLQIYYDFSGYSDMAVGLAAMFGFRLKDNFLHPYGACGIKDFWRRWHISLTTWFREYVYIPLGGNRCGKWRTERTKLIVFFLTGIWHGANWTFVLWGLLHGCVCVLEDTVFPIEKCPSRILKNLYTWLVVCVSFVIFRADTVGYGLRMLGAMFGNFFLDRASLGLLGEWLNPYTVGILVLAVLLSYPVGQKAGEWLRGRTKAYPCLLAAGSLVMLFCCMMRLASAAYNPFIYFRF